MPRPLTRTELLELRDSLLAVRARVQSGELCGSRSLLARLDGACVALSVVLGETPDDLLDLLGIPEV
jgi:hypothetical protein